MNFWKRRGDEAATAQTMQLRNRERHPYAGLRSFTPQRGGELRLYQAVREAVPVVDAAVCKLIRLSGGALVFCEDPETETRLRDFLERVPAGRGQYGINAFLEQYLESLLCADIPLSDREKCWNSIGAPPWSAKSPGSSEPPFCLEKHAEKIRGKMQRSARQISSFFKLHFLLLLRNHDETDFGHGKILQL